MTKRQLAAIAFLTLFGGRAVWASGTMPTPTQLGNYALAGVNAANSALLALQGQPNGVAPPPALVAALQRVQSAAQALSGLSPTGQMAQDYSAAVAALLPVALPYLSALGPAGAAVAVAVAGLNSLVPVILAALKQPQPAAVATAQSAKLLPPMTSEQTVKTYGPKL